MRPTLTHGRSRSDLIWDVLTFERMQTGPVVHLIYWAGLGLVALFGFSALGAGVGFAIRGITARDWTSLLIAVPVVVAGLLIVAALALVWRGMCEFYIAVFRIAEDLRALRRQEETHAQQRIDEPPLRWPTNRP
ncbi:MAG TPA: DUF4282 domain-containing protein [Caulobacteraceae bacterium]|nr:DUF4282 domain-containing protein [Caulobacteraceae bacterium]